jgi:hypothetical protein
VVGVLVVGGVAPAYPARYTTNPMGYRVSAGSVGSVGSMVTSVVDFVGHRVFVVLMGSVGSVGSMETSVVDFAGHRVFVVLMGLVGSVGSMETSGSVVHRQNRLHEHCRATQVLGTGLSSLYQNYLPTRRHQNKAPSLKCW